LKAGQSIGEYAYDLEVQQGINIAEAAAVTEGLQRYIYSSLPSLVDYGVGDKYKYLYHIASKPAIVKHISSKLPDLAKITSYIELSVYYELWSWGTALGPRKGDDGKYYVNYLSDGTVPVAQTSASMDTGPCVLALLKHTPGVTLSANSERLSYETYLRTLCEVKGLPYGGVNNIGFDAFAAGIPGPIGIELAENFAFLEDVAKLVAAGKKKLLLPEDVSFFFCLDFFLISFFMNWICIFFFVFLILFPLFLFER
jgi:hypothetical protein